jgi:peptidoglycan hydrolase FlgJ
MTDLSAALYAKAARGHVLQHQDTGASASPGTRQAKARAAAVDFESVFLQSMIGEMMSGLGKEGPLGEGEAGGAWRSMLVQQYAGAISKSGGIGLSDSVYRDILALQEKAQGGSPAAR